MFGDKKNLIKNVTLAVILAAMATIAKANPPWANNYIGEVKFKLRDNPKLAQHLQQLKQKQNQLQKATSNLSEKKIKQQKLLKQKNNISQNLIKLDQTISTAATKKIELENQKATLPTQINTVANNITKTQTDINALTTRIQNIQTNLTNTTTRLNQIKSQCDANPTPQCQQKVAELITKKKNIETNLTTNKQNLVKKQTLLVNQNNKLNNLKAKLSNIDSQIAKQNQIITANSQKKSQLQIKFNQTSQTLTAANTEVNKQQQIVKKLTQEEATQKQITQQFRQQLIARILDANSQGANFGGQDGRQDGRELANDLGTRYGQNDGSYDGESDGTRDGKARDYRDGYQLGEQEGTQNAQNDGKNIGTKDGTVQGNTDAATIAGKKDGEVRAVNSDAASVGTEQGKRDGMARAIATGKTNGTKQGKKEAINKFENVQLKKSTIDGQFATSFSRRIPDFPIGHRGNSFNPNGNYRGRLMSMAYADGYRFRYRKAQRRAYANNIDHVYYSHYDQSYNFSYRNAHNRHYEFEYSKGRDNGNADAYNRVYPGVYQNYFNQYREKFKNSPNISSTEYQSTYKSVEQNTYNYFYEVIRKKNFDKFELLTFNNNIEQQTKKYRDIRFAEVSKVYQASPVLSYVSSMIVDGGIKGSSGNSVAALDGIYQPQEDTFFNITLKNFSLVPANDVKVILDNGTSFKIPSIAAQGEVTVKGAAKAKINKSQGETYTESLTIYSPITHDASIQARHFFNSTNGQLNDTDKKTKRVQYPLNLISLSTNGALVIKESNNLSLKIQNNSSRAYSGPIKVKLTVDSQDEIIKKGFSSIQKLNANAVLSDAKILVTQEADTYTPLSFHVDLTKDGVKLGNLNTAYVTMAKAPYIEKIDAPVIVANAEQTTRDLVDTISSLGGINQVSILDMSLKSKNSQILNSGVNGKTLLTIDNGSGSVLKEMDNMLSKSKHSTILVLDDSAISGRIRKLNTFSHSLGVNFVANSFGAIRVYLSNPLLNKNHKNKLMAFRVDRKNFKKYLPFTNKLKLSNEAILREVQQKVTEASFFTPNEDIINLLQALNLKINHDVLTINDAYMKSGNLGNRDKKIAELVRKDTSLLHNQLAANVSSSSTAGMYLVAYDNYWALKAANDNAFDINLGHRVEVQLFSKGFGGRKSATYPLRKAGEKKLSKTLRKKAEASKAKYRAFKYSGNYGDNNGFNDF